MVIFAVAAVPFCDVILLNGPFSQACENPVAGTHSKSVTENQLNTSKDTHPPTTHDHKSLIVDQRWYPAEEREKSNPEPSQILVSFVSR